MAMKKGEYIEAIGRRKTSTARVRIYSGNETSTVNEKPLDEYFKNNLEKAVLLAPLAVTGLEGKYYFSAMVNGGGYTGQQGAVQLGLARAIYKMDPDQKSVLRKAGLITRDPRMVERKKYHHLKARKKPQFSKR